jgi:hypothetical protein
VTVFIVAQIFAEHVVGLQPVVQARRMARPGAENVVGSSGRKMPSTPRITARIPMELRVIFIWPNRNTECPAVTIGSGGRDDQALIVLRRRQADGPTSSMA